MADTTTLDGNRAELKALVDRQKQLQVGIDILSLFIDSFSSHLQDFSPRRLF